MRKTFFGMLSFCALGACVMSVLNFPNQKNYSGLVSENVEALAGPTELPELVVSCDKEEGQCWKEGNVEATCPDNTKYKECYFDGSMSESCSSPC